MALSFEEEKFRVQNTMIKFGGSFFNKLGHALCSADPTNARKIKKAFPEYWEKYLTRESDFVKDIDLDV